MAITCDGCKIQLSTAVGDLFVYETFLLCRACSNLPKAVCMLVEKDDGTYLGVSRKDDHSKFGLPGGKVDPGETTYEAIQRELTEETGLYAPDFRFCFVAICPGGKDGIAYLNVAFKADKVVGEIHTNEPHVVKWVPRSTLLAGPFSPYITKLLAHVDKGQGHMTYEKMALTLLNYQKKLDELVEEGWNANSQIRHLGTMIPKMLAMLEEVRSTKDQGLYEKLNRWLGFVQGVFFSNRIFSLDEMKGHNR